MSKFKNTKLAPVMNIKKVTVFGSSRITKDTSEYKDAYRLGKFLGERGLIVKHGGYDGIMEAITTGMHGTKGKSVGITLNLLKKEPSRNLSKRVESRSLFNRLRLLTNESDAFIVFRGNLGTMSELLLIWMMLQNELQNKNVPIFLVGKDWMKFVIFIRNFCKLEEKDISFIQCYKTSSELIKKIFRED